VFKKLIFNIGVLVRNNYIFRNYDFLLKSQKWSIEELEAYQLKRLKALLESAYEKTPYYRKKFDSHGFHPKDLKTLEDLKLVPVITKEELLENVAGIQIKDYPEKLFFSETSGSTGKPLIFYRNKDWDAWHRASIFRGYSWYGVEFWERNGYFWGYNIAANRRWKTKLMDFLVNRFRLFTYDEREIGKFIKKLEKATYLSGYSSMIYEVAKKINESGVHHEFNLKMVKGTSEKIFERYQADAERAFGRRIISEYGSAEAGIIAFECPHGNMHINMETVIVEEENNEIIATNLVSGSFPVIRYKLGDYIEKDTDIKCACGMSHHVIKEVLGRVGKVIYGKRGMYPSLTLYYVFKNLAMEHGIVLNYQAVQRRKGILEINVENTLAEGELKLLRAELEKYFTDDMETPVIDGADLRSRKKKKTDFISEIADDEKRTIQNA